MRPRRRSAIPYLAAKTTVDDRALNRQVLAELRRLMPAGPLRVLEAGAAWDDGGPADGLGRRRRRRVHPAGCGPAAAGLSRRWLSGWAAARGLRRDLRPDGLQMGELRVRLVHAELGGYLEAGHAARADVLIANAVLDLVDVPAVLPGLLRLLVPGGATGSRSTTTARASSSPATPPTTRSCRPITGTWTSASATAAGREAGPAAACSTTCGRRGRPRWRRGRRTGWSAPARTGPTRPTRLTSCAAS